MPLIDKKIPGWLKGAAAGMLLLTVGDFIHQTYFVGWRTYQVLIFTDTPFSERGTLYSVFLDDIHRPRTFFIDPAPGDSFGLYSVEPLRLPKRTVVLELVPSPRDPARQSHRFEIANKFDKQVNCDILVRLRNGVPTVEGCIQTDYDASHFADFVHTVN